MTNYKKENEELKGMLRECYTQISNLKHNMKILKNEKEKVANSCISIEETLKIYISNCFPNSNLVKYYGALLRQFSFTIKQNELSILKDLVLSDWVCIEDEIMHNSDPEIDKYKNRDVAITYYKFIYQCNKSNVIQLSLLDLFHLQGAIEIQNDVQIDDGNYEYSEVVNKWVNSFEIEVRKNASLLQIYNKLPSHIKLKIMRLANEICGWKINDDEDFLIIGESNFNRLDKKYNCFLLFLGTIESNPDNVKIDAIIIKNENKIIDMLKSHLGRVVNVTTNSKALKNDLKEWLNFYGLISDGRFAFCIPLQKSLSKTWIVLEYVEGLIDIYHVLNNEKKAIDNHDHLSFSDFSNYQYDESFYEWTELWEVDFVNNIVNKIRSFKMNSELKEVLL